MRDVHPEVYLVGHSTVVAEGIKEYLEDIGGSEWFERMKDSGVHSGEALIEFGGRLCYRSWVEGLNANVTKVRKDSEAYFSNLLKSGHGSVLEHTNFSFVFHNVSRVFTHELVRHRAGMAYSQESMRYVRLTDIPFWLPGWARADEELWQRSAALLQQLEDHQVWMAEHFKLDDEGTPFTEKKAKTSFMRRFAPDGVATGILATGNVRAWRHIICMRTDPVAEEEIRLVIDLTAQILQLNAPLLFGDLERADDGTWTTTNWKV